ncbi:hypothetical protein C8Q79DRAFT_651831 [Trametes meyenii]|nr:hypothetical protein C8Q79DRAFT_651831 [Trametes meyenii]
MPRGVRPRRADPRCLTRSGAPPFASAITPAPQGSTRRCIHHRRTSFPAQYTPAGPGGAPDLVGHACYFVRLAGGLPPSSNGGFAESTSGASRPRRRTSRYRPFSSLLPFYCTRLARRLVQAMSVCVVRAERRSARTHVTPTTSAVACSNTPRPEARSPSQM